MFEDEDEIITPAYWATGQDENIPAIDAILNHRLRDDTGNWPTLHSQRIFG